MPKRDHTQLIRCDECQDFSEDCHIAYWDDDQPVWMCPVCYEQYELEPGRGDCTHQWTDYDENGIEVCMRCGHRFGAI